MTDFLFGIIILSTGCVFSICRRTSQCLKRAWSSAPPSSTELYRRLSVSDLSPVQYCDLDGPSLLPGWPVGTPTSAFSLYVVLFYTEFALAIAPLTNIFSSLLHFCIVCLSFYTYIYIYVCISVEVHNFNFSYCFSIQMWPDIHQV